MALFDNLKKFLQRFREVPEQVTGPLEERIRKFQKSLPVAPTAPAKTPEQILGIKPTTTPKLDVQKFLTKPAKQQVKPYVTPTPTTKAGFAGRIAGELIATGPEAIASTAVEGPIGATVTAANTSRRLQTLAKAYQKYPALQKPIELEMRRTMVGGTSKLTSTIATATALAGGGVAYEGLRAATGSDVTKKDVATSAAFGAGAGILGGVGKALLATKPAKVTAQVTKGAIKKIAETPEAYGAVGGVGIDENGNVIFSEEGALLGIAGTAAFKRIKKQETFEGFKDISTKVLEKLKGKSITSKQEILDFTNAPDLKQAERELIREVANDFKNKKVSIPDFADKVRLQLLPLTARSTADEFGGDFVKYENINLSPDKRGNVANYTERIYESPIRTSAGKVHFADNATNNYFAHTRIDDMGDGSTRRILEIQSDLFQKGGLEKEGGGISGITAGFVTREAAEKNLSPEEMRELKKLSEKYAKSFEDQIPEYAKRRIEELQNKAISGRKKEISKLEPYRNTWHERIIREEVKQAAKEGKTKLQVPTGETAMQIEGLGQTDTHFAYTVYGGTYGPEDFYLDPQELSKDLVGKEIRRVVAPDDWASLDDNTWVISDILEDGKFKAVQQKDIEHVINGDYSQSHYDRAIKEGLLDLNTGEINTSLAGTKKWVLDILKKNREDETFDISGKADQNNPIYKFYEKEVGKYLKNKYGATRVIDDQGVEWWQVAIKPELGKAPVEAFGVAGGFEVDEDGKVILNPDKAMMGMLTVAGIRRIPNKLDKLSGSPLLKTPAKEPDISKVPAFNAVRESVEKATNFLRDQFDDDMYAVKQLVENPDIKITEVNNPYMKEKLMYGRIESRRNNFRDRIVTVDADVVEIAKRFKVSDTDLKQQIDDYLITRHAPERNKVHGDGAAGITTKEAEDKFKSLNSLPYAGEIKRVAEDIQNLHKETLEVLLEGEVISQGLYDQLKNTYKHHVPLQRVMPNEEDFGSALGRGLDVRSTGLKRAKGSELEVADIVGNVVFNYEQALIRAEKNRVDLSTLALVRENKTYLDSIGIKEAPVPIVPVATEKFEKVVDPVLHNQLLEFASKNNIEVIDKIRLGRGGQKILGLAQSLEQDDIHKIKLRVASEEQTFAHEMGHIIDAKFKKFTPEKLKELDDELAKIAKLRTSEEILKADQNFATYLLSRNEKVAEAVSIFITDRSLMAKVAPKTKKYLEETFGADEILKDILNMKPSRQRSIKEIEAPIFRPQPSILMNDPKVLTLREKGELKFIQIDDTRLAVALKGIGREYLPTMFKFVGSMTRFYSGVATRYNLPFAFSNKIRDLQETLIYGASQKELRTKGAAGIARRELKLENEKAIFDWMRGKKSKGAELYDQMRLDGGTTGGMGLSTKAKVELDIKAIRKLNRSKPRQAVEKLIRTIDDWNTIFEDSTRLSVYREALEQGASRDRAAELAKEASINFNKFGKSGPIMNAVWMFSNASVRGSTKMLKAMKDPKVAASVATTVGLSVYAVNQWNDRVDPEWRDKISKWDRLNSLPVMLPSKDEEKSNYLTIPVSWGIKPMKIMADQVYDLSTRQDVVPSEALGAVVASAINAYNPVGGTDLSSAITPTVLDLPLEIAKNQAWHGGKIRPDWNEAASTQYFADLADTTTGRVAISITKGLSNRGIEISPANINYAFEQIVGGAGRTLSQTANTLAAIGQGDELPVREIPVINRFFKQGTLETFGTASRENKELDKLNIAQDKEAFYLNQKAEETVVYLNALPREEAAKEYDALFAEDEELAKKVTEIIDMNNRALTYTDRKILRLGVTNGQRALFIFKKLEALKDNTKKAELWDEYTDKKIITDTVADQLNYLLENR